MQHSNYNENKQHQHQHQHQHQQQQQQQQQHHNHHHHSHNHKTTILSTSSSSSSSSSTASSSLPMPITTTTVTPTIATAIFTNTAKLPIETVKLLIASVSRHPNLWIRTSNGQKRCDINTLWQQVSQEVHLPADICRIKWGHLRDNFRKVFIRNTLSGEPPTTWRFYNDMRFMEGAVAENVMRQHRLREQSLYWQELHQAEQKQKSNVANFFDLRDNYERSMTNQFNYSELSTFLEHTHHEPFHKHIKLEPKDGGDNFIQQTSPLMPLNGFPKTTSYEGSNHLDDDDDDDFDEDAASTEEDNYHNISSAIKDRTLTAPNDRIIINHPDKSFTVTNGNDNGTTNDRKPLNQPASKLETDNFSNTELTRSNDTNEQDSDRMFLLSLLPYLRRVSEQRKLKVRQRLQSVLIEEFG